MPPFFITTAIDYANGDPHLGHALEKIGADVIARYRRMCGDDVFFMIGMDEHGQKNAQAAEAKGVAPDAFVTEMAGRWQKRWDTLGISYDRFMRTTDADHKAGVLALIERIFERNPDDFYERSYEGWYCVGCESFKLDSEIADGTCPLHPTLTLQRTAERNWFFRLSKYQSFLETLIKERPGFIQPDSRRNEILGFLAQGLEDVSASRSRFSWGVPFPRKTSDGEQQTTYVWFDALPNYLTATGFPATGTRPAWPAQVHVVGKDITRFHCIIWPAMLESAGLPMPETVWAHGFMSFGGSRFSKSAGNWLDPIEAAEKFGPDALRYFVLREVPFDGDGDFSWERFEERYNSDLANALGNLASRVIAMVEKYRGGVVPGGKPTSLDAGDAEDLAAYHAAMDGSRGYLLHEGLKRVMSMVARGNEYVQASKPWGLAKNPEQAAELDDVLAALVRQLGRLAVCLAPFMPGKSAALWAQLGAPGEVSAHRFSTTGTIDAGGWRLSKGEGLFPRSSAAS